MEKGKLPEAAPAVPPSGEIVLGGYVDPEFAERIRRMRTQITPEYNAALAANIEAHLERIRAARNNNQPTV